MDNGPCSGICKESLDPPLNSFLKSGSLLSANELFRYRKSRDKAPPQKGGTKDYAPDGSWLEQKKLESFHKERKHVLSEQRVEMMSSLVIGEWNQEKQLVEFEREIGKFWTHMGFIDHNRKWLYPEEALFLMESGALEVSFMGVPLSIQQGYTAFLSESISLEEYQVYAHLRRHGYVVLRHQGKIDITKYEREIGLDQYIDQKLRKRKIVTKGTEQISAIDNDESNSVCKKMRETYSCSVTRADGSGASATDIQDNNNGAIIGNSSLIGKQPTDNLVTKHKRTEWHNEQDDCFHFPHSRWNFDDIVFPDVGSVQHCTLAQPLKPYLPVHVEVSDFTFDVEEYKSRRKPNRNDREAYVDPSLLNFSLEMPKHGPKVTAQNWTDYKDMLKNGCLQEQTDVVSPAKHLWEEEITPLVRPTDATSTANLLEKLQVIQNVNLTKQSAGHFDDSLEISFDVYLPDLHFKKSSPGIPNHRVCVLRSCDGVTDLKSLVSAQSSLRDSAPLNLAVIDCGEIVFYTFTDTTLPVDITMG
ncbi:hypothetical protein ScPMuIL_004815 [Solemya velum]